MLAYFDCFSGISGDMTLGALVDAGLPLDHLRAELAKLPVDGYALAADRVQSHGLAGPLLRVDLDAGASQPHRHLADVVAIIQGSDLADGVKARASAVFRRLAEAEARVHGVGVEEVHCHEVGAVDAIVDVPVIGLPVSTGYGFGGAGVAARLSMLQTCAPGLAVVNIDNGVGAGAMAGLIANRVARARARPAEQPAAAGAS